MLVFFKQKSKWFMGLIAFIMLVSTMAIVGAAKPIVSYGANPDTAITVPNGDFENSSCSGISSWNYFFQSDLNEQDMFYHSDHMTMSVTANGHNGNGLLLKRTTAADKFNVYSDKITLKPSTTYSISYWVKATGAENTNLLKFSFHEYAGANSVIKWQDNLTVAGATEWTQKSLEFATNADTDAIQFDFYAIGVSEFTIDDIEIREGGLYKQEGLATGLWSGLTLSAEVKLTNAETKYEFLRLPYDGEYTLSFDAKGVPNDGQIDVRMDGFTLTGERFWYPAIPGLNATYNEWTNISYTFKPKSATENTDIICANFSSKNTADYSIKNVKIVDADGKTIFTDATQVVNNSSDGDNSALNIKNHSSAKVNFIILPQHKTYTLKYFIKGGNAGSRVAMCMDNYTMTDVRKWYLETTPSGMYETWTEFSTQFKSGDLEVRYLQLEVEDGANYLFDNFSIVGDDGTQYIPNGSFVSKANLSGYSLKGSVSTVKQEDGSYAFFGNSANASRGEIGVDISNLRDDTFYTLSFKMLGGFGESFAVKLNCEKGTEGNSEHSWYPLTSTARVSVWTEYSVSFKPYVKSFKILLSDGADILTAIKDISIKDANLKEYNRNVTLKEIAQTENIYSKGSFTGDTSFTVANWTLNNATIAGNSNNYMLQLNGTASATSDAINVSAALLTVSYTKSTENAVLTLKADTGDIISKNEKGMFIIPSNVKSAQLVFATTNSYATIDDIAIAIHSHVFTEVITKAPTCSAKGSKTMTCSACGESYTEEIPMLDHSYDAGVVTTAPTCSATGVKTFTCSVCGGTYTEEIPMIAHTYLPELKHDATNHWQECSVCEHKESIQPHVWGDGVITTAPTCTTKGVKTFTCSACSESRTEEIPMIAHTYLPELKHDATNHWQECFVCEHKESIQPHVWGDGVVSKEATCTEKGQIDYACRSCSEKHFEEIAPIGHDYDAGVITTAPTCTAKGIKTFTCKNCGETYTEEIAELGHDFKDGKCVTCGIKDPNAKKGCAGAAAELIMSLSFIMSLLAVFALKRK